MVDFGYEFEVWWLEWVVLGEFYVQFKLASLERRVWWPIDMCTPMKLIVLVKLFGPDTLWGILHNFFQLSLNSSQCHFIQLQIN